jgi:hypothetical protein
VSKQYKNMCTKSSDEFQTPEIAIHCLLPHLPKEWVIWECAWGSGSLATHLINAGYTVVGNEFLDFLCEQYYGHLYDCVVTNPPYSLKNEFLAHCYELGKPFALLMPLSALEGRKRGALYREYGIQLIIPNKRINFVTPTGEGSGAWFQTAWFTWKFNLPKDLMFVNLGSEK